MKINFWFEIVWGLANGVVLALKLPGLGDKENARIRLDLFSNCKERATEGNGLIFMGKPIS